jgi:spore germination cell wall hydrolase CwlJ-like protein
VMNRVRDHRWPDTVCEVVYQPYQFSWTAGNPVIDDVQAWSIAYAIASGAVSGELVSMVGPANHYHAITVAPKWAENMKRIRRINNHIFYLDEGFAI